MDIADTSTAGTMRNATGLMGRWTALAMVMGSMIGSGVLLLPADLAPFGWNSVFGWIVTITGCVALAVVFGALSRVFPKAGGAHVYARAAFGPFVSYLTGWALWATYWIGSATICIAAVSYLSRLFPVLAVPGISIIAGLVAAWTLIFINMASVKLGGRLQLWSLFLKVIPLLAVVVLALFVILKPHGLLNVQTYQAADIGADKVMSAAVLALYAMLGFESATIVAEKVRDPARNVPWATVYGTAAAGLIYLLVCSAVVLMLPAGQTAHSHAPFGDFVDRYWGVDAGTIISLFGVVCALGAANGSIIVQGEIPAGMANDGLFPRWLGTLAADGSPVRGHWIAGALMTMVLLLNTSRSLAVIFKKLVLLTVALELLVYLVCACTAARLIAMKRLQGSIGLWAMLALSIPFSIWAIFAAGVEADLWGSLLLIVGVVIYYAMHRTGQLNVLPSD